MDFRSLTPFGRAAVSTRGDADPFQTMRREMDRLFEDMTRGMFPAGLGSPASGAAGFLAPRVDVSETAEGLDIVADLPGIDQKDIELDVADDVLTLKASHTAEKKEDDDKRHYHVVERTSGTYLRRFALPFPVDEDRIAATFDKGVLKVSVPRAADDVKQSRRIEIKGA
jgi:HSP20 family protein